MPSEFAELDKEIGYIKLSELNFSARLKTGLSFKGLTYIFEIAEYESGGFYSTLTCGKKEWAEVQTALHALGVQTGKKYITTEGAPFEVDLFGEVPDVLTDQMELFIGQANAALANHAAAIKAKATRPTNPRRSTRQMTPD